MDFLFRSNAPGYRSKGKASPSAPSTGGFLANLWCSLFGGGAAPSYRSKGQASGATAPDASPCWAGLSQTPQYKAPPEPSDQPEPEPSSPGDDVPEQDCPCDEPAVIPQEIHIYPGG